MKRKEQIRRRFFCAIFLVLVIGLSLSLFYSTMATGSEPLSYIEITVEQGDTLWELAQDNLTENQDIRAVIYEIRELNNLSTANLTPGQIIRIPVIPQ